MGITFLQIWPHKDFFFSCILVIAQSAGFQRKPNCQTLSVCNVMFDLELKNATSGFWPVFYVAEAQNC